MPVTIAVTVPFMMRHPSRSAGELSPRGGAAQLFRSDPDGDTEVSSRRDQLWAIS